MRLDQSNIVYIHKFYETLAINAEFFPGGHAGRQQINT